MCGVCGVLGGARHWSSVAGVLAGEAATTPRAERARLAQMLDRIARRRAVRVTTWSGTSFVVSGPTGAQEIADNLTDVWAALDRLAPRPLDPLDSEWQPTAVNAPL